MTLATFGALAACGTILDVAPDSVVDGGADHSRDGSTAEASTRFCAASDGGRLFCDDFDDTAKPAFADWSSVDATAGSSIVRIKDDQARSKPNVLASHVEGPGHASLDRAEVPTNIRWSFQFEVVDLHGGSSVPQVDLAAIVDSNGNSARVLMEHDKDNLTAPTLLGRAILAPGDPTGTPFGNMPPPVGVGEWHRITIAVVAGPDAGAIIELDAKVVLNLFLPAGFGPPLTLRLGARDPQIGGVATVQYDDVTVDSL